MALRFDEICIDAHDATSLGGWWSTVLGLATGRRRRRRRRAARAARRGPNWIFLAVPDEKVVKNRIHLDFRPDDQQAEVDRVLGLGARRADIGQRGDESWVVLADPEGNEFCILAAED